VDELIPENLFIFCNQVRLDAIEIVGDLATLAETAKSVQSPETGTKKLQISPSLPSFFPLPLLLLLLLH
jgi:hypothetical protein